MTNLIEKIDDLIKQATIEQSHFYVGSLLKEIKNKLLSDMWQPINTAKHSETVLMFAVGETYWIGSRCHNGVIYISGDANPDSGTTLYPDQQYDDDIRIVAWRPLPKKPFTYKHGLSNDDISKLLEKL